MKNFCKKNEKGQSTIEFIIVSVFAFGFLAIFIQLAINLSGGFFVHYATFMASRTFLVADFADSNADRSYTGPVENITTEVFEEYNVKPYGVYDPNASLRINSIPNGNTNEFIYTGVVYKYTQPMSVFGIYGANAQSTMVSESFLGKEPTRGECLERIRFVMRQLNFLDAVQDKHVTVFDNGC